MLKDYYYTDKEELDALRAENAKLRQELNKAVDEIADLKAKLAKNQKRGGKTNDNERNYQVNFD